MPGVVVIQTAFLGDVVLTTPLLRELRRARPGASITVVTAPVGGEALAGHPCVDAVEVFDKRGRERGALGFLRVARRIREASPDIVVAAQRSARSGLLALASGAPLRIGFEGASGRFAYSERVPWKGAEHAVRRYLALAAAAGGDASADPAPHLPVSQEARSRVAALLAEAGIGGDAPVLAVAPGSIWGTKRWIPGGFADVVKAAPGLGLAPVLVGSAEERALCDEVARASGTGAVNLAGRCRIPELAAALARALALVSNDSGAGHVASAVGTPVVSIFGPTAVSFGYTPFGAANRVVEHPSLPCRPCDRHGPMVCPLGHFRCMREIPPERVLQALRDVLRARS